VESANCTLFLKIAVVWKTVEFHCDQRGHLRFKKVLSSFAEATEGQVKFFAFFLF